jgi:hypothetical protein
MGQTTDLAIKYGLPKICREPLSAKYDYAGVKAKYPAFIIWAEYKGLTQAEILSVNEFAAAWNNEVWATDGYIAPYVQDAYPQNGCQSRGNIDASGVLYAKTNIPCTIAFGIYSGGGTGNYTDANGSTGGTQIEVDHATWVKRVFPERNLFQTDTWGNDQISGYQESFIFQGFRLEGGWTDKVHDPSFSSSGVAIWDSGETSRVQHNYAYGFNSYGFQNVRGTPSIFDGCSAFSNGIAGFGLLGNDLSTIAVYSPSGDDNPALIYIEGAYGRPGGGTVTVISNKNENGKRQPPRDQVFIRARGACNIVAIGTWVHSTYSVANVIEIDFQDFNGGLDVSGLRYDGYANLLKLTAKGVTKVYPGPGAYAPISFIANETGVVFTSRDMGAGAPAPTPPTPVPPTPTPVPPTPTPVPPTPTPTPGVLTFATTFSGTSNSTIVATTGSNVTQSTSWARGTIRNGQIITQPNCSYQVPKMTVRKIVYLGLTVNSASDWGWLNSALRIRSNGDIILNGTETVVGKAPIGTKVARLEINLSPVELTSIIGAASINTGGCPTMTIEGMEIYS